MSEVGWGEGGVGVPVTLINSRIVPDGGGILNVMTV